MFGGLFRFREEKAVIGSSAAAIDEDNSECETAFSVLVVIVVERERGSNGY